VRQQFHVQIGVLSTKSILNRRSFRFLRGIYTCRKSEEPIWHYFSRQTDFIDLCTAMVLCFFFPSSVSLSRTGVWGSRSQSRERTAELNAP